MGFGYSGQCRNFVGCPKEEEKFYSLCNFVPDWSKLPPLIPNGRYKIEIQGVYNSIEVWLMALYGEVIVQAFKFASNEYREFPLRFLINLCDLYAKDAMGIGRSGECRNFSGCPREEKKFYTLCNFVPDMSKLPPLIANGRYKIELQAIYNSIEMWIIAFYGEVTRSILTK
ncbi:hypothetical protein ILUMI_24253 [Ignelater luminosus]|uniref:Uncharacterized protein n=1 Tax=Ignelater luminosus TaxID=2038154 RepID=A0A8K0G128_IGNLU|nr:hypothetical protein ILUMI_24253 [Ignelater luminosus]